MNVTSERWNDHRTLHVELRIEGRLLVARPDFPNHPFDSIARNSGVFTTRLATNVDLCIAATHRQWRRRAIKLQGELHTRMCRRLKRDISDVELPFNRRVYGRTRRTARRSLRLIAVRLPRNTEYRFYRPNIDPDSLDPHSVAQTYAAPCQLTLIFSEMKSHCRLAKRLSSRFRCSPPSSRRSSTGAPTIRDIVVLRPRVLKVIARRLNSKSMLSHEVLDPNRSGQLFIERIEYGGR